MRRSVYGDEAGRAVVRSELRAGGQSVSRAAAPDEGEARAGSSGLADAAKREEINIFDEAGRRDEVASVVEEAVLRLNRR
jgi:hypothetical protein